MPERLTFTEQLLRNVRPDDATGCWVWISSRNRNGYGQVTVANRSYIAHRWTWENLRTPIPDGMQVDHLCRNRTCVNPQHLQVVTPAVNVQRGVAARGLVEACGRGHAREVHGYITQAGRRACRECNRQTRYTRHGLTPRARRATCEHCGRSIGEQNLSRHEAACTQPGHQFKPRSSRNPQLDRREGAA